MKQVNIFTDGACKGNPGPGGWGAILDYKGTRRELSDGEPQTTNNRMELSAVIAALSALTEPCEVTLTSDSKYVVDAVGKGWVTAGRSADGKNQTTLRLSIPTCGKNCSRCFRSIRSHSSG